MPIRTILYGGAFDMPHIGHKNMATQTLRFMSKVSGYKELWFLPRSSDTLGIKKPVADNHRVAMLEIMTKEMLNSPLFSVCTDELEMTSRAGTYAVVKELIRNYPERKFCYLMGSDQAKSIRSWRNSRKLIMTIPCVVVQRAGISNWNHNYWYYRAPHTYIDGKPTKTPMSSSAIRHDFNNNWDKLKADRHIHLLRNIHKYIVKNKLYQEA